MKRRLKIVLISISVVLLLILIPFGISFGNIYHRLGDGSKMISIRIDTDERVLAAGLNNTVDLHVEITNDGPLCYMIEDFSHSNMKDIRITASNGTLIECTLMCGCVVDNIIFGPFDRIEYDLVLGGLDWNTGDMLYGDPQLGSCFYFNEPGEYKVQAFLEEDSSARNGDHLPDSIPLDVRSNVISVIVE